MAKSHKTGDILSKLSVSTPTHIRSRTLAEPEPLPPTALPVAAPPASPVKYWEVKLRWAQDHGFTHTSWGGWLQLPPEFDAIMALEHKPVAQVILEILRKTTGWIDQSGDVDDDGKPKRIEWARITHEHFSLVCGGAPSQASHGLEVALEKRYIERRRAKGKGGGYEYRVRWSSPKTAT